MTREAAIVLLSQLSAKTNGNFRGAIAVARGVHRNQLTALCAAGVIVRELVDTYRMAAVPESSEQKLRAALLWAGDRAAAAGRSAAEIYRLEGVRAPLPEIVIPRLHGTRAKSVHVHRAEDLRTLMIREHHGWRVTGIEPTLMSLAHLLDGESFEIACEDARRRRLTTTAALEAHVARFGGSGRPGSRTVRALLDEVDPVYPSRSTLEVKTRRLLVAHRLTDFVREFPLEWKGRTYLFDFNFEGGRTILETNGRRWHDDPLDYEHDNEKWSVPGRHGYKLVLATWDKVTRRPDDLIEELRATLR